VKQPVYIYLFGRFADFVNIEVTEKRIRESLHLVDTYRQAHGGLNVSATILLSGALSQALAERNSKTGIKDYILDHVRRGVIELGYDGADEPTYKRRPVAGVSGEETAEQRWLARVHALERFLTESRDLFGLEQKGKSGGLKAMQEVFGEAACITGLTQELGGDSEAVHALSRHNTKAIMWGIPDPDPARNIHGYRGSAESFGYLMSPAAHFSPELNWVDNVLRSSETSDAAIRLVSLAEGPQGIRGVLEKLARKHIRIVHVEIGDRRMYLSEAYRSGFLYPPLRYAYDHPDRPQLPAEAAAEERELAASMAKQKAALEWLAGEFLPANAGSRFVSSSGLKGMTPTLIGETIAAAELKNAAHEFLKSWATETYLLSHIQIGDRHLSLADSFYVLANALAARHRTGKLPESVQVAPVFGPLETPADYGPALGKVAASSVDRLCAVLADRLNDRTWKAVPANMIPARLEIDGIRINGAQFLKLMFASLVAPSPETRINVQMTNMHSIAALVYPRMRQPIDQGGTWTFRPAPLNTGQALLGSRH
jgi:hypothetical protein